jgi:twitching motility protein PilU
LGSASAPHRKQELSQPEAGLAYEEAIRNADSANELRLNIKLKSARGEPPSAASVALSMHEEPSDEELQEKRQAELLKQQEKTRQVDHQRMKQLHLERNLQLEKKRRLEDQQLETLRLEKKALLEELVR